jgi:hypothetical protein
MTIECWKYENRNISHEKKANREGMLEIEIHWFFGWYENIV